MIDIPVDVMRRRLEQARSRDPREPRTVYVTDLVRCPLKRYYEERLPGLAGVSNALNGRILFGEILHIGAEALLKELYGDRVVTERDADLTRERPVEVDGVIYTVVGRIDAVLDRVIGVEVKTNLSDAQLPLPWHADQARLYNWLYGFQYTVLLYVTPTGLYQYTVADAFNDAGVARMIREETAPRYQWECKYCPYAGICPVRRRSGW